MSTCIICQKNKELTDEHVVPEFLGGGLVIKSVCSQCNSNMGSGFEGRLADSFIYKTKRFIHKIAGKSGIPFPFSGTHYHEKMGSKFNIQNDGTQKLIPQINLTEGDSGLRIQLSVDESDANNIQSLVEKKISRFVKSKGAVVDKNQIAIIVKKAIKNTDFNESSSDHATVNINTTIDFEDISLLHVKVAYELAYFHFGEEYLRNDVASTMRQVLYSQSLSNELSIRCTMDHCLFDGYFDKNHHWVVFSGTVCYINIFGIKSFIKYTSDNSSYQESPGVVYKFSFDSSSYEVLPLIHVLIK